MNDAKSEVYLIAGVIIVALAGSALEFVKTYWYIFAILAAILLGLFLWLRPDRVAANDAIESARVQDLIRVFTESAKLVETSANIETVDERYGVMVSACAELAEIPSPALDEFRRELRELDAGEIFNAAARRYVEKQLEETSRLKTTAGRKRRVEKIEGIIDGLANMPHTSKVFAKELLRAETGGLK